MYFTHPQLKFNIENLITLLGSVDEAELKKKLASFFPKKDIVFTNLGRSAFQLALKNLKLEKSEMLVPAYICDIFLPIFKKYKIKPVYLDIDLKTFNINPSQIENKINNKTKSILISHTYGLPNEIDKILEIAKKYNLKVIEDCAHAFGIKYRDKYLGNFGDCAFFSFSKFIPTINGGMLICKKTTEIKIKNYKSKLFNFIKFLRLFPSLASFSEKFRGDKNLTYNKFSKPRKASKKSLKAFDYYLDNFKEQINNRTELANYFQEKLQEIGFQTSSGITYVSALTPKNMNRDKLFNKLKKEDIFCSRIWHKPIYLKLPNTSQAAKQIINFPLQNWFTKKHIDKIISCI